MHMLCIIFSYALWLTNAGRTKNSKHKVSPAMLVSHSSTSKCSLGTTSLKAAKQNVVRKRSWDNSSFVQNLDRNWNVLPSLKVPSYSYMILVCLWDHTRAMINISCVSHHLLIKNQLCRLSPAVFKRNASMETCKLRLLNIRRDHGQWSFCLPTTWLGKVICQLGRISERNFSKERMSVCLSLLELIILNSESPFSEGFGMPTKNLSFTMFRLVNQIKENKTLCCK